MIESVKARLLELIATLDKQIAELDEEIEKVAQKLIKAGLNQLSCFRVLQALAY